MDKVEILTTCDACNGKAYLPTEEVIFIGGWKYFRHKACSACQGTGRQLIWITLSELVEPQFHTFRGVL